MNSLNRAQLLGRLGQNPEVRYTKSGSPVCNFSLATSESWTDKGGEKVEKTQWHQIVVWGKLGELCGQHLSKGSSAYVEGRMESRPQELEGGQKKWHHEIIAERVIFLGAKKSVDGQKPVDSPMTEDDIPF